MGVASHLVWSDDTPSGANKQAEMKFKTERSLRNKKEQEQQRAKV